VIAVDTSLLAYAVNRQVPGHRRAADVLETLVNGDTPWALPWPVVHEFLALVTHPHAVARVLRPASAWAFVADVLDSPSVRALAPTARHAAVAAEVLELAPDVDRLTTGFEVAVLLREHGVRELLSADRAMRRFRFLTVRDPVHGELWTPGAAPERRYRVLTPRTRG
jgi:toxin-antitoxin system PIN domain toxin